jgi:hypothetical protein
MFFVTFMRGGGGAGSGRDDHHGPGGPGKDFNGPDPLDWPLDNKPPRNPD